MAEHGTRPVAGVGQHGAKPHSGRTHAVQFGEGNLPLAARRHISVGDACPGAALGVEHPTIIRQEQAQAHRNRHFALCQGERNQRLAVSLLAELPAILSGDTNRQSAVLRQGSAGAQAGAE